MFVTLVGVWVFLAYRGRATKGWLFWLTISLGMVLVGQLSVIPELAWVDSQEKEFAGVVYSVQRLNFDTRIFVRLAPSRLQVAVHLPREVQIEVGDELIFQGTVAQPQRAFNPGVFCYRDYLKRQGVFGVCYPKEYSVKQTENKDILNRLRLTLRQNLVQYVRDPALVLALVLGDRDGLSGGRKETWRLLGVSHLLAISGMHVGFMALGLAVLTQRLPLKPLFKLMFNQVILFLYILLAGSGASAWRALLACILGGYAGLRGLQLDPLQIWASVGWVLLLVKPTLIFDPGFTLSFAASGGILLWGPTLMIKSRSKILIYLANSLVISTVAQLSLLPLLFNYFGEFSLLGSLSTLVFLPCVVVLLIGGLLVAVGLGPLGIGALLNWVMALIDALENMLIPLAYQWKWGGLSLLEPGLWWALFIYAGWRLKQPRLTKPRRTYAHLTTAFVVILVITSLPAALRRPLEITAVNVGQGDCYYIRTPSGLHLLIDGGGDSPYWQERGRNVGEERLVPYLRHRQVPRLDYVILSHPHEDHLFGLLAILEHFDVGMVIDNGYPHNSPTYQRYLEFILEKNIPYHMARAGDELKLGDGITLDILYPNLVRPELPSAQNNNSLLLRLQYGGMKLLFTGDLEWPVLYDLAHDPAIDLRAEWLKVPHHGSRGSLQEEFYQAVNPKWAMISVGPNSFGHPHPEVIELLVESKIKWRSTQNGPETFLIWWGLVGRFTPSPS